MVVVLVVRVAAAAVIVIIAEINDFVVEPAVLKVWSGDPWGPETLSGGVHKVKQFSE